MRTFNRVTLLGRVVLEPYSAIESGTPTVRFAIETRRLPSDKAGDSDRHTIACWGRLSNWVGDSLKLGMVVLIDGRLCYDTRSGIAEVQARDIILMTSEDLEL